MKGKVLTLIIGILIGAIIATGGFLIYSKTISNDSENQSEAMEMNENGGQNPSSNGNMSDPPSKPDGDNGEEPPSKPDDSNSSSNSSKES